jgi:hypothetical protein
MQERKYEIASEIVLGSFCLYLGITSTNLNYQVLFYLLTAMFYLAVFRPKSLP